MRNLAIFCCIAFFTSSLFAAPLGLSLIANPSSNGGNLSGEISYSWNKDTSSAIRFDYYSSSKLDLAIAGFDNAHQVENLQNIQFDIFPFILDIPGKQLSFTFSFGLSYLHLSEKLDSIMLDTNGYLLLPAGQYVSYKSSRIVSIFAPTLGLSCSYKSSDNFAISFEGYFNPIYYLIIQQKAKYSFMSKESVNDANKWSTPFIDSHFSIDFFKFFRVSLFYSFQRLSFQTMDWNNDGSSLIGVDDIQLISKIKIGLEIILPTSGNLVRVTGGVYWQWLTNQSDYWGTLVNYSNPIYSIGSFII